MRPKSNYHSGRLGTGSILSHSVPDKIQTRIHIKFTPPISTSYYCCTITPPIFQHEHAILENSIYYFRLSKDAFITQASLILNNEPYYLKRKIHTRNFYFLSDDTINTVQASIIALSNDHYALIISVNRPINVIKIRLKFYSGLFHNNQRFTYFLPFEISATDIKKANFPVPQQNIFIDHSILVTVSSLKGNEDLKTNYDLVNKCHKYQTIEGVALEPLALIAKVSQPLSPHSIGNFFIKADVRKKSKSYNSMPLYIMLDIKPEILRRLVPLLMEYNNSEYYNNKHKCQFQYRQLLSRDNTATSASSNRQLMKSWCDIRLDSHRHNTHLITCLDLMVTRLSQINKPYKVIVITDNKDHISSSYWDNISRSLVDLSSSMLIINNGFPNCSPFQAPPIQEYLMQQKPAESAEHTSETLINVLTQIIPLPLNNDDSFGAKKPTLEDAVGYSLVEHSPTVTNRPSKRTLHMAIVCQNDLINNDISNRTHTDINAMLSGSMTAIYKVTTLDISDHGHYTTHLNKINEDNMNYKKAFLNSQNIKNYLDILKATRGFEQPCVLKQHIHHMENQRRQVNLIIIHLFKLSTMIDPVELACISNLKERHTAGMSCYLAKWFIIICQLSKLPLSQELLNTLNTLTRKLPESAEWDLNNEFDIS